MKFSPFVSRRVLPALLLGSLCAFVTEVNAETVELKNGTSVTGQITYQDREKIIIKTATGNATILKASIKRIIYRDGQKSPEEIAREKAEADKRIAEQRAAEKAEADKKEAEKKEVEKKRIQEAELKKQKELEDQKNSSEKKSSVPRSGALLRSAFLPGLGQWYLGKKPSAAFFFAGTATSLLYLYDSKRRLTSSRDDYNKRAQVMILSLPTRNAFPIATFAYLADQSRKPIVRASRDSHLAQRGLALFWTASMLHVFFGSNNKPVAAENPIPGFKEPPLILAYTTSF